MSRAPRRSTSATTPPGAIVDYDILVNGTPATPSPFSGRAVRVNGRWVVSQDTLCGLVQLSGTPSPDCQALKR
jgi:hypothetical protein